MNINYKVVSGILAVLLANQIRGHYLTLEKYAELKDRHANLFKESKGKISYLANKLDANGIPTDDFDELVIRYYTN